MKMETFHAFLWCLEKAVVNITHNLGWLCILGINGWHIKRFLNTVCGKCYRMLSLNCFPFFTLVFLWYLRYFKCYFNYILCFFFFFWLGKLPATNILTDLSF